jgi:type II secretory pathway component GspD/PulD (secretin)
MRKIAGVHSILFCLIAAGLLAAWRPSLQAAETTADAAGDNGGQNPFALLLAENKPEEPAPAESVSVAAPELRMATVVLKFLDAESVKEALNQMVSPYGRVAVNKKTNSVVVCAPADDLDRIIDQIRQADQMPSQVTVEVVILDVQLTDDTEIGVNWDLLSTDLEDFGYRQNLTDLRLSAVPPTAENLAAATAYNTLGYGGEFSVLSSSVRNVLHVIQQKRDVDILAAPRAMVVSGQTATIRAVEEIPYKEIVDTAAGGAAALTATRFKQVGVTLQVQATVTDGNNIFLAVDTEQSVTTGVTEASVPVTDTREANTSLLLRDGQTVVMGGLRREERTKQVDQIPILGDLPVIGLLFKNTTTVTRHSELVVLLSPHIYRGEAVSPEIAARVEAMRSRSPLRVEVLQGEQESNKVNAGTD